MQFTSQQRLQGGVIEREFTLGEIPGTLWTPQRAPAPLILMAHNNGLPKGASRLVARARHAAAGGYAVATIDAAGCGDRPRSAADERARADLGRTIRAGEPVDARSPRPPGRPGRTPAGDRRRAPAGHALGLGPQR